METTYKVRLNVFDKIPMEEVEKMVKEFKQIGYHCMYWQNGDLIFEKKVEVKEEVVK